MRIPFSSFAQWDFPWDKWISLSVFVYDTNHERMVNTQHIRKKSILQIRMTLPQRSTICKQTRDAPWNALFVAGNVTILRTFPTPENKGEMELCRAERSFQKPCHVGFSIPNKRKQFFLLKYEITIIIHITRWKRLRLFPKYIALAKTSSESRNTTHWRAAGITGDLESQECKLPRGCQIGFPWSWSRNIPHSKTIGETHESFGCRPLGLLQSIPM